VVHIERLVVVVKGRRRRRRWLIVGFEVEVGQGEGVLHVGERGMARRRTRLLRVEVGRRGRTGEGGVGRRPVLREGSVD